VRAANFFGDRRQRFVAPALVLKAFLQDDHADHLALVLPLDDVAWRRQSWVPIHKRIGLRENQLDALVAVLPWSCHTRLSAYCQLLGLLQRGSGQPTFFVGLKTPSDATDQVLLIAAPAFFFEDLFVALDQLANRFVLQLGDFQ
jgi:hypothetical protein